MAPVSDELSLLHAALTGDFPRTQRLLEERKVDVDCAHPSSGMTPLCCATHGGHLRLVEYLLQRGAAIDKPCSLGTAVLVASVLGLAHVVQYLVNQGANVRTRGRNGITPLSVACNRGHVAIVRILADHFGSEILREEQDPNSNDNNDDSGDNSNNPNNSETADGETTTDTAGASADNANDNNENDNVENNNDETTEEEPCYGFSAFACAFMSDQYEVLRYLINEHGMDVNSRLRRFRNATPLYFAATQRNAEMVSFLLDMGARANQVTTVDGETPLFTACRGGGLEIVQRLIHQGNANVNVMNRDGATPLLAAIHSLDEGTIDYLLEHGADPNQGAPGGVTPLFMATSKGLLNVVKALVRYGASIHNRRCAVILLHLACRSGHAHIVQYLLQQNVVLRDACESDKWMSPITTACEHNHSNLVRFLVREMVGGSVFESSSSSSNINRNEGDAEKDKKSKDNNKKHNANTKKRPNETRHNDEGVDQQQQQQPQKKKTKTIQTP